MLRVFVALVLLPFTAEIAPAANCSGVATGFPPLVDPFILSYRGFEGGLYPGGVNVRPAGHEAAGMRMAAEVRPRDANGAVDENGGVIVLLSIGMSNTTQEFQAFLQIARQDREINPRVVLVDGAQGGWSAERIVANGAEYWDRVEARLRSAGVTPAQVQVGWMKEAHAGPTAEFPEDARLLQADLKTLARELRARFPNLRLLYLSSRTYAGYASTALNPEPYAYQSGFAVKWVIKQQMDGDPELSFDSGEAPWLAWGPYLWGDGTTAREDGLQWECGDFNDDGTHPSSSGRLKVARMLMSFLKTDSTARGWFLRAPEGEPAAAAIHAVVSAASYAGEVTNGAILSLFGVNLAGGQTAAEWLPLPTSLAETSVLVGGVPAVLYFVSAGQINLVAPWAPQGTDVVVVRQGRPSAPFVVQWAAPAPQVFQVAGAAAALHAGQGLVTAANPARRGETIQLLLTGLGVRNPLLGAPTVLPRVVVGGVAAEVDSSGPAPGNPGLSLIEFRAAVETPAGDAVPLRVETPTGVSPEVSLAVAQ